jgi:hypothetical protein
MRATTMAKLELAVAVPPTCLPRVGHLLTANVGRSGICVRVNRACQSSRRWRMIGATPVTIDGGFDHE